MKNFWKTKGYYVILFACVAAVSITGVIVLQNRLQEEDTPVLSYATATPKTTAGKTPLRPAATPKPTDASSTDIQTNRPVTPEPSSPSSPTASPKPEVIEMVRPLEGDVLKKYAADKLSYNKTTKEWRTHPAVDIVGTEGAQVVCAYAGKVQDIKQDPRYGTVVVVDHGNGLTTLYCGFATLSLIAEGDTLEAGAVLGSLGNTIFCESEDGIHLHFEVHLNGKNVDPSGYVSWTADR